MDLAGLLIPLVGTISFFGCTGFVAYLYFKSRHKERMALIETGQDASIFRKSQGVHSNLKWGYLGIAIGIALLLGHFLEEFTTMDHGSGYFPMVFILGGLALIIYYNRAKDDGIEI